MCVSFIIARVSIFYAMCDADITFLFSQLKLSFVLQLLLQLLITVIVTVTVINYYSYFSKNNYLRVKYINFSILMYVARILFSRE